MPFDPNDILPADATVSALIGPLFALLKGTPGATELCINQPGEAFVLTGHAWQRFEVPELTLPWALSLATAVATFTEQAIGPSKPILSAMLPQGERLQVVVPPALEPGRVSLSVRIPSTGVRPLASYEADGMFSRYLWARSPAFDAHRSDLNPTDRDLCGLLSENRLKDFIVQAVQARKNIAIVGNTGSGKTTLLKSACQVIPTSERLITVEDVREVFLPSHPNCVHLLYSKGGQGVAQVTPADLIAAMMRMKPDRGLVGELRGGEAFDYLKLLTTGHAGMTSFHAESCALAAERFIFMCKEHPDAAAYDPTELRRLIGLTLDIVIHVVAQTLYDAHGQPQRLERYVAEVQFDPVARLARQFGQASLHVATAKRERPWQHTG